MICPYNRKSEKQILQWTQENCEVTNQPKSLSQTCVTNFVLAECMQNECGAWHNGRCCYASANLDNR